MAWFQVERAAWGLIGLRASKRRKPTIGRRMSVGICSGLAVRCLWLNFGSTIGWWMA